MMTCLRPRLFCVVHLLGALTYGSIPLFAYYRFRATDREFADAAIDELVFLLMIVPFWAAYLVAVFLFLLGLMFFGYYDTASRFAFVIAVVSQCVPFVIAFVFALRACLRMRRGITPLYPTSIGVRNILLRVIDSTYLY